MTKIFWDAKYGSVNFQQWLYASIGFQSIYLLAPEMPNYPLESTLIAAEEIGVFISYARDIIIIIQLLIALGAGMIHNQDSLSRGWSRYIWQRSVIFQVGGAGEGWIHGLRFKTLRSPTAVLRPHSVFLSNKNNARLERQIIIY